MSRNYNQKLSKKNWKVIIIAVFIAMLATAMLFKMTDNLTTFAPDKVFARDLNEDNLFYEKIEDGEIYDNIEVDAIAKNGIITLNGNITDTSPATIDQSTPIDLVRITLPAGEYTFTCFDNPNIKSYYAVGTYSLDGETYTWYADFDEVPNNSDNDETLLGKTVELTEETEVTFEIRLIEGATLKNVKAVPVLVEGDEDGSYYAPLFKVAD